MAYSVVINFDDGSSETLDETFETWEDADEAAKQWASDFSQGGDYLREAGEEPCDTNVTDWDINEI